MMAHVSERNMFRRGLPQIYETRRVWSETNFLRQHNQLAITTRKRLLLTWLRLKRNILIIILSMHQAIIMPWIGWANQFIWNKRWCTKFRKKKKSLNWLRLILRFELLCYWQNIDFSRNCPKFHKFIKIVIFKVKLELFF